TCVAHGDVVERHLFIFSLVSSARRRSHVKQQWAMNGEDLFFGSSLPGVGRIHEPETFCGANPPPHPHA
ncbi:MAG: hypothetical protein WC072_06995, partial [Methanoregulaceae archaeon]